MNLDLWRPYLLGKRSPIRADARLLPFRDQVFDIVVAVELLEHLDKKDGIFMVSEMERVSRRAVIFSTPKLWFEQPDIDGNPYQRHRSHYSRADFPQYAYFEVPAPWGPFMFFYGGVVLEPETLLGGGVQEVIDRLVGQL